MLSKSFVLRKKNYSQIQAFLQEPSRIKELSEDVKTCPQDCLKNLQYFSIAVDESTDTTDTAQFAAFVHGVSSNLESFRDFVELVL